MDYIEAALAIDGCIDRAELAYLLDVAMQAPERTTFVELGCYQGRSTAIIALSAGLRLGRCVAIDKFRYRLPSSVDKVNDNLRWLGLTATVLAQDSRTVPAMIRPGDVGFLHIDTKHTREQIIAELDVWAPMLHAPAFVTCHDYGRPWHPQVKQTVDAWFGVGWRRLGLVGTLVAYRTWYEVANES